MAVSFCFTLADTAEEQWWAFVFGVFCLMDCAFFVTLHTLGCTSAIWSKLQGVNSIVSTPLSIGCTRAYWCKHHTPLVCTTLQFALTLHTLGCTSAIWSKLQGVNSIVSTPLSIGCTRAYWCKHHTPLVCTTLQFALTLHTLGGTSAIPLRELGYPSARQLNILKSQ